MSKWQAVLSSISDEQLSSALQFAHIPALMAALVHITGNRDHFALLQPQFVLFAEDADGLTEAERETAREFALSVLQQYRDSGCPDLPKLDTDDVIATMNYITGMEIKPDQIPFNREELNLYGEDSRRVVVDSSSVPEDYKVLIIGSGMSGILAAIRLQQEGIPYLIIEKNPDISGTWYENTYPGCQVDSANHLYSYIFEPNSQWPGHFSGSKELYGYFHRIVEKYGLRKQVRLNTRAHRATYNQQRQCWEVEVESGGSRETLTANSLISAVGQLNSPKLPDIDGLDTFTGVSFHSARWGHEHALAGKRVIVIGTGCSAAQFVPEIAPECGDLKVFQRSAPWLQPAENYHQSMADEELWLFRELPMYARWYRFFLFRTAAVDGLLPLMYCEPNWQGPPGTIGAGNEALRSAMIESLTEQAGTDKELLAKLIPDYPPGGKRPVLDDGSWISALKRDNVQLLTEQIARVVPEGLLTSDGILHEADVIIFGTGFKADQFLVPMQIIGRDGRNLVHEWASDPRAYLGAVVSGFPNFYCLYGPNSNIVTGSSIVFFVECQMRYVMGCLKLQLEHGRAALECKDTVMEAYNRKIDELNRQRAWGAPSVNSWYKNSTGRVTQNWPGTHAEWWQQTRSPDPDDFHIS